jgi:hypothetical protein
VDYDTKKHRLALEFFYDRAPIDSPGHLLTERRPPFLLARPNLASRLDKGRVAVALDGNMERKEPRVWHK